MARITPFIRIIGVVDHFCCAFCQSQRDRVIPTKSCTPEMLPPFAACSNKDGCRCWFGPVGDWEIKGKK